MTTTGDSAVYQPSDGVVEARVTDGHNIQENGHIHDRGAQANRSDVHTKLRGQDGQSGVLYGGDGGHDSSIMKESDNSSDQGYATLSHSTPNGVATMTETHSTCAMLNVTPAEPLDTGGVELDITSTVI